MNVQQKTVEKEVRISGVGIHTGEQVTVRLLPAEADSGIRFVRTDLAEEPEIPVNAHNVVETIRETTVGQGNVIVHTVEHVLAALAGHNIDNCVIAVDGEEMPALDGSALPVFKAIQEIGVKNLTKTRRPFKVREPIWLSEGDRHIAAFPANGLRVSYTMKYDHARVGTQYLTIDVNEETFEKELAAARTFCLMEEVEQLRNMGLIKGGSLGNAVVFGPEGKLNEEPLRFPDECVRHKILDLVGDLHFLGAPLHAHVVVSRGGHALNIRLVRKIAELRAKMEGVFYTHMAVTNEPLDVIDIKKILPHRYPMLLVDRVLCIEKGKSITALKNVTQNEPFFEGHFPKYPIMPGVLVVEAMAQAGGLLALSDPKNTGRLVFFMGIDKVKFRRQVRPGDQLIFEVEIVKLKSRTGSLRGKTFVNGQLAVEAELNFTFVEE